MRPGPLRHIGDYQVMCTYIPENKSTTQKSPTVDDQDIQYKSFIAAGFLLPVLIF